MIPRSAFLSAVLMTVLSASAVSAEAFNRDTDTSNYQQKYTFTMNAFTGRIPVWEKILAPYAGQPGVRYLEIGVYEGRSFFWMLENILTGEGSQATALDTFPGILEETFRQNLVLSGQAEKTVIIKARSQDAAKTLPAGSFDIIYVDGSHVAPDVLADSVLAFDLLKNGGLLIFDDYKFHPEYPEEHRPTIAIDAFLSAYRNRLEKVHEGSQMIVRKRPLPLPCDKIHYCSPFGGYGYSWEGRKLYPEDFSSPVEISEEERLLIEKIASSRKPGEMKFVLAPEMENDPVFQALLKRLNLTREKIENLGREITA